MTPDNLESVALDNLKPMTPDNLEPVTPANFKPMESEVDEDYLILFASDIEY